MSDGKVPMSPLAPSRYRRPRGNGSRCDRAIRDGRPFWQQRPGCNGDGGGRLPKAARKRWPVSTPRSVARWPRCCRPNRPARSAISSSMIPSGQPMQLADLSGKDPAGQSVGHMVRAPPPPPPPPPCRHEMPALDQLQREMGSDTFEVGGHQQSRPAMTSSRRPFSTKIGVDFARLLPATIRSGSSTELKRRNLAVGLPVTLLIDDEGCLLAHMNGPAEWASERRQGADPRGTATAGGAERTRTAGKRLRLRRKKGGHQGPPLDHVSIASFRAAVGVGRRVRG